MTVRRRVIVVVAIGLLGMASLGGLMMVALTTGSAFAARAEAAHRQFEVLHRLEPSLRALEVNAAHVLDGEAPFATLEASYERTVAILDELGEATARETEAYEVDDANELLSLEARLSDLHDQVVAAQSQRLAAGGRQMFEHRLEGVVDELARLAQAWMVAETREVQEASDHLAGRFAVLRGLSWVALTIVAGGMLLLAVPMAVRLTRRFKALLAATRRVGEGDYATPVEAPGEDELARVADALNEMMRRLQANDAEVRALNAELVRSSHWAGMAEVAAGVLHNVGNVLNSVNVSTDVLTERSQRLRTESLAKIVELLEGVSGDLAGFFGEDRRAKHVLAYLRELVSAFGLDRDALIEQCGHLKGQVAHLSGIIAKQQDLAKATGLIETLPLVDVVDYAVSLTGNSLANAGIELVREYEELAPFPIDRHRVLQVVLNLLLNARDALKASDVAPRRLEIAIRREGERAVVAVGDNGVGIAEQDRPRIFMHGFTTKPEGHGFGLHNSHLAAQDMGAVLSCVESRLGQGSTFHLALPLGSARE